MIEMDETEHTADQPARWWELLDDSASFLRFHYDEIMQSGSDELKHAAEIILGGHAPAVYNKKGESA